MQELRAPLLGGKGRSGPRPAALGLRRRAPREAWPLRMSSPEAGARPVCTNGAPYLGAGRSRELP